MPGGISDPLVGYATFAVVKFAGYCGAAMVLGTAYPAARANPAVAGLTRTVIGLIVGAVYGTLVGLAFGATLGAQSLLFFLAGLIPLRFCEWWLLIWLYYDREFTARGKGWRWATAGTAWSFVLDLPAIIGAIATAGFWIC